MFKEQSSLGLSCGLSDDGRMFIYCTKIPVTSNNVSRLLLCFDYISSQLFPVKGDNDNV